MQTGSRVYDQPGQTDVEEYDDEEWDEVSRPLLLATVFAPKNARAVFERETNLCPNSRSEYRSHRTALILNLSIAIPRSA